MNQGSTTNGDAGTIDEYDTEFEQHGDESVATTIAVAVAEATGQDVTELDPLGSTIDCESLDSLVRSAGSPLSVSFLYEGCRIFVSGDGTIEITLL
ncbi:HalOD1 output domain-containing protein [Haloarchaeobius salinus]|uniref:HalOD1 output domain-containing protein n=1 Tax=Haloarchaeobius salinus TaxID=1198298 RepID=UPI00210DD9E2|nr:HalOD1 output domain-containing protein [Haloarchaeobius salinus]